MLDPNSSYQTSAMLSSSASAAKGSAKGNQKETSERGGSSSSMEFEEVLRLLGGGGTVRTSAPQSTAPKRARQQRKPVDNRHRDMGQLLGVRKGMPTSKLVMNDAATERVNARRRKANRQLWGASNTRSASQRAIENNIRKKGFDAVAPQVMQGRNADLLEGAALQALTKQSAESQPVAPSRPLSPAGKDADQMANVTDAVLSDTEKIIAMGKNALGVDEAIREITAPQQRMMDTMQQGDDAYLRGTFGGAGTEVAQKPGGSGRPGVTNPPSFEQQRGPMIAGGDQVGGPPQNRPEMGVAQMPPGVLSPEGANVQQQIKAVNANAEPGKYTPPNKAVNVPPPAMNPATDADLYQTWLETAFRAGARAAGATVHDAAIIVGDAINEWSGHFFYTPVAQEATTNQEVGASQQVAHAGGLSRYDPMGGVPE